MRHLLLLFLSSCGLACHAAPAPPNCLVETETNNSKLVACDMAATASAGAAQVFVANFSGGHDDTDVSIKPSIEGASEACLAGSKLSSFGEDGDIRLHCAVAGPGRLRVAIRWSHAEFTDFQLAPAGRSAASQAAAAGKSP